MEQLTKETREILITQLKQTIEELEFKRKIVSKETEFLQSYKIDCVLLEQKIAKIGSILIDGEFEF